MFHNRWLNCNSLLSGLSLRFSQSFRKGDTPSQPTYTQAHAPKKKEANVNSNIKTTNKLLISITLNIYCSLEEDEKDWGQSRRINWIDKPTKVIRF